MRKTPNDPIKHLYDWERVALDDATHKEILRQTYGPLHHKRLVDYFRSLWAAATWWRK